MSTDETDRLECFSDAHGVEMCCECGECLSFDQATTRIDCDCGASYAVTITQLAEPSGRAGQ
jgi:hypothetical protein